MTSPVLLIAWLVAAYLVGSVPTSYLTARYVAGVDLRTVGSGNLGATNLYRSLGWGYAIPVGLIDIAKGVVPVMVFAPRAGGGTWIALVLGVAAVLGHVFPVWLGFKGGKGVATSAGVVLGLAPFAFGIALVVWALTVRLTGFVSLASMAGAVTFPVAVAVLYPESRELLWTGIGLGVLILLFHRDNIRRLVEGTEHRVGRSRDREAGGAA